jgi:hypothetical protein
VFDGCNTWTSRASAAYGKRRRSTPFTTLNTAVVAPTPSAIVTIEMAVKVGTLSSVRMA